MTINGSRLRCEKESRPDLEAKFADYPVREGFRAEMQLENSTKSADIEVTVDGKVEYSKAVDLEE